MKTTLRWTIGPVSESGFQCLSMSVRMAKKIYPEFDRVICHNQLNADQLRFINQLEANTINQHDHIHHLPYPPEGETVHWKLFPPRVSPDTHEICLDNDVVLLDRIYEIDKFLEYDDKFLSYQGLHSIYGQHDKTVSPGININSGIYGLPPRFDFQGEIENIIKPWEDKFDEQGIVATIIHRNEHFMISQCVIPIIEKWMPISYFSKNKMCKGFHFVGLNYQESHKQWNQFRRRAILHG